MGEDTGKIAAIALPVAAAIAFPYLAPAVLGASAAAEGGALAATEGGALAGMEGLSLFSPELLATVNLPGAATTVGSGGGFLGPIALPTATTAASSFGPGAQFSSLLGAAEGKGEGGFDLNKALSSAVMGKLLLDSFKTPPRLPQSPGSISGPTVAGGSGYRGPTSDTATQALIARMAQRRRGR